MQKLLQCSGDLNDGKRPVTVITSVGKRHAATCLVLAPVPPSRFAPDDESIQVAASSSIMDSSSIDADLAEQDWTTAASLSADSKTDKAIAFLRMIT